MHTKNNDIHAAEWLYNSSLIHKWSLYKDSDFDCCVSKIVLIFSGGFKPSLSALFHRSMRVIPIVGPYLYVRSNALRIRTVDSSRHSC